jgi:D-sedoheptulose 7-phosphate isomerase
MYEIISTDEMAKILERAVRLADGARAMISDITWSSQLAKLAAEIVDTHDEKCITFLAGNGGSAAQADHFAAELVGRFETNLRRPISAIPLLSPAILTAVANDLDSTEMFASAVRANANRGDLLILLSTSGSSHNIIRAIEEAHAKDAEVWVITGNTERLEELTDISAVNVISVTDDPDAGAALIQELTLLTIHSICSAVDVLVPLET